MNSFTPLIVSTATTYSIYEVQNCCNAETRYENFHISNFQKRIVSAETEGQFFHDFGLRSVQNEPLILSNYLYHTVILECFNIKE